MPKDSRTVSHRPPSRPFPGRWQGYARPTPVPAESTRHTLFDPRIVVLGIAGRRVSLPAALKLTAALRGLLMRECPEQPPPEWFSGHRADGRATLMPHMALAPLPFVGSQHSDGRIMGLALILPVGWIRTRPDAAWFPLCGIPRAACRANTGCSTVIGSSAPLGSKPASGRRRTSIRLPGRRHPASGPA